MRKLRAKYGGFATIENRMGTCNFLEFDGIGGAQP